MTRLGPASGVAVLQDDSVIYVADLPDGPIAVLDGVAAVIWAAACEGRRETVAARVAAVLESAGQDVSRDIDDFVAALVGRGLLAVLPD